MSNTCKSGWCLLLYYVALLLYWVVLLLTVGFIGYFRFFPPEFDLHFQGLLHFEFCPGPQGLLKFWGMLNFGGVA